MDYQCTVRSSVFRGKLNHKMSLLGTVFGNKWVGRDHMALVLGTLDLSRVKGLPLVLRSSLEEIISLLMKICDLSFGVNFEEIIYR